MKVRKKSFRWKSYSLIIIDGCSRKLIKNSGTNKKYVMGGKKWKKIR
jgi:hypothetical protein